MSIKFKYFKITEQDTLDHIEQCILSIITEEKALSNLAKDFGARDCLQYSQRGVAAFSFDTMPDRSIWKKVKHGYMPKVKTKENKLLENVPKSICYKYIIKKYNFGGEMLIGEQASNGSGFRMHSSYLKGNKKTGFYAIVVPYHGDFDAEVHDSLVEIQEWEVVKGASGE